MLVLFTNRKSYMSFLSLPKSVTLHDLEGSYDPSKRPVSLFQTVVSANYKTGKRTEKVFTARVQKRPIFRPTDLQCCSNGRIEVAPSGE